MACCESTTSATTAIAPRPEQYKGGSRDVLEDGYAMKDSDSERRTPDHTGRIEEIGNAIKIMLNIGVLGSFVT